LCVGPNCFEASPIRHLLRNAKFALILAVIFAAGMWFYVQRVMIPHQVSEATLHGTPRGNLSDLYPRWLGARELLLRHRDPYSAEVTREIQIGYYGRALDPTHPRDPADQQGFAYPIYVVFLLAPTIALPFPIVQAGFRWLLILLTTASVPLWLRVFRLRLSPWTVAAIVMLVLGSFQVIQGIRLQQLSLLAAGLMTLCAFLVAKDRLAAAGILLALATIKPQLALPLSGWLLVWTVGDWRQRKTFAAAFIGTMVALVVMGELVLPGWIGRFQDAVIAYRRYNDGAESILQLLFTPVLGNVLALALVLGLAIICWKVRALRKESLAFHWFTALILAATVLVAPKAAPYNQVLLLAPVLLIASRSDTLWKQGILARATLTLAALIFFFPWLAALAIATAAPLIPVAKQWVLPLYTMPAIPLAVSAVMVLTYPLFLRESTTQASANARPEA